jgi:hypothetical protein
MHRRQHERDKLFSSSAVHTDKTTQRRCQCLNSLDGILDSCKIPTQLVEIAGSEFILSRSSGRRNSKRSCSFPGLTDGLRAPSSKLDIAQRGKGC